MRRAKYEIAERTEAEWDEMPDLATLSWWCKRVLKITYNRAMRLLYKNELQHIRIYHLYFAFKDDIKAWTNNDPRIIVNEQEIPFVSEFNRENNITSILRASPCCYYWIDENKGCRYEQYESPPYVRHKLVKWDDMPDYATATTWIPLLHTSFVNINKWCNGCGLRHFRFTSTTLIYKKDLMFFLNVNV